MQDFRNLEVWRLSHELTLGVYAVTRSFPNDEKFGLVSQLRRASISIEANLAEGCGRGGDADFARFVQISMGSASEVECELLVAKDLGLISTEVHGDLEVKVQRIKQMLVSLLRRLRSNPGKADSR